MESEEVRGSCQPSGVHLRAFHQEPVASFLFCHTMSLSFNHLLPFPVLSTLFILLVLGFFFLNKFCPCSAEPAVSYPNWSNLGSPQDSAWVGLGGTVDL